VSLACVGPSACTSTLVDYSVPAVHIVQPGETLYAIAWRHGIDYQSLARWNGLANPDFLAVGQRLVLRPSAEPPAAPPRPTPQSPPQSTRPVLAATAAVQWSWPTDGPVLRRFGDRSGLSNGVGIGGSTGQDIRAAAAGQVVYAGSGLQAYGQLVIINHDNEFLSAYGYNAELLVTQGEAVSVGQRIARMGVGPERRAQLHFEIRRNGTPVDPLAHLPRR
jgi:lipoprotein NlpD